MRRFCFHPEAEREFFEQQSYYDECEAGLGARFAYEVWKGIKLICESPQLFAPAYGVRNCFLQIFPFNIVFEELDGVIVIYAVAHTRRRPGYWRNRVSDF